MLCQNCGRQVEFVGNVCPWCGAKKQQSQATLIFFWIGGIIGLCIGGFIGHQMEPEAGAFIGGVIGGIIGGVIGILKTPTIQNSSHEDNREQTNNSIVERPFCPHCGCNTGIDTDLNPDKFCVNCGKRFGG